ncbi:MAG: toll/interleukin-1 receptor domain-containing protein [Synergistaceae bacterium]|jgi:hypothetical protein|nr:toll/interleukin-1 receptor domain-containing protein [Synergistaceae bacterium]
MIFISHALEDLQFAEALKGFLSVLVDIAPDKILCSWSHYPNRFEDGEVSEWLKSAISSSDVIFAIVTPSGITTDRVLFELGAAWVLGKKIILFHLDGADFRDLPPHLGGFRHLQVDEQNAPVQIISVCKEAAASCGLEMKRGSGVPLALAGMVAVMRRQIPGGGDLALDKLGSPGAGLSYLSGVSDDVLARARAAEKWGTGDYCEISLSVKSAMKQEAVAVRILWDDLYKAIAPNVRQPQDEHFIRSLFLNLCRERDANLRNGLAYKILVDPSIKAESFSAIISRLVSLGYIATSRPPNSIFQKATQHTFWKITQLGEEYLAELITERRKITTKRVI